MRGSLIIWTCVFLMAFTPRWGWAADSGAQNRASGTRETEVRRLVETMSTSGDPAVTERAFDRLVGFGPSIADTLVAILHSSREQDDPLVRRFQSLPPGSSQAPALERHAVLNRMRQLACMLLLSRVGQPRHAAALRRVPQLPTSESGDVYNATLGQTISAIESRRAPELRSPSSLSSAAADQAASLISIMRPSTVPPKRKHDAAVQLVGLGAAALGPLLALVDQCLRDDLRLRDAIEALTTLDRLDQMIAPRERIDSWEDPVTGSVTVVERWFQVSPTDSARAERALVNNEVVLANAVWALGEIGDGRALAAVRRVAEHPRFAGTRLLASVMARLERPRARVR